MSKDIKCPELNKECIGESCYMIQDNECKLNPSIYENYKEEKGKREILKELNKYVINYNGTEYKLKSQFEKVLILSIDDLREEIREFRKEIHRWLDQ